MHISSAAPRLQIFAHVDATAGDIAPHEAATVDAFEKAWRPDVDVKLQLRHIPSERPNVYPSLPLSPAERTRHRAISAAAMVGIGGMAAAAFAFGPSLGWGAAAVGIPAALAMGYAAIRSGSLLEQGHSVAEPTWEGTRTYDIQPDRTNELDSPVLASRESTNASVAELAQFLKSPPGHKVVILAGHGHGPSGCAGFSMRELQLALEGSKPDLVVFESCLMGNVEALDKLHGTARFAVVSEQEQLCGLEHWKPLLETLPAGELDGETVGRHILQQAQNRPSVTTLALVDLDKVHELHDEMQGLVTEEALQAATLVPRSPNLRDVGSVLDELEKRGKDVAHARQTLREAVLVGKGPGSLLSL